MRDDAATASSSWPQAIRRLAPSTEFRGETINGVPADIADKTIGAPTAAAGAAA